MDTPQIQALALVRLHHSKAGRNNSTSSISGVYAVSSTSAGRTRSRTPRCWRGHSSPALSPPCARHRHAGQVTYPECQTPEYLNSCTVNLVKGQGRQEDSAGASKTPWKLTSRTSKLTSAPGKTQHLTDQPGEAWSTRAPFTRKLSGPTPPKKNVGQERLEPKTPSIRPTLSGARPVAGATMPASVSSAISGHTAERS